MKTITAITFLFCLSLSMRSQSYELVGRDTINLTDAKGKKQGKWVVYGRYKPGICKDPYKKVEEGEYKDNKKIGIWITYYCSGTIHHKITFTEGRADGPTTIYNENGTILEEGIWKYNIWVGPYKIYCGNGTVIEYNYNETGKTLEKKSYKVIDKTEVIYSDPTKK